MGSSSDCIELLMQREETNRDFALAVPGGDMRGSYDDIVPAQHNSSDMVESDTEGGGRRWSLGRNPTFGTNLPAQGGTLPGSQGEEEPELEVEGSNDSHADLGSGVSGGRASRSRVRKQRADARTRLEDEEVDDALNVLVVTWNLAFHNPNKSFDDIITDEEIKEAEIIAVGMQSCVYQHEAQKKVEIAEEDEEQIEEINKLEEMHHSCQTIQRRLNRNPEKKDELIARNWVWTQLKSADLQEMRLVVFVRKDRWTEDSLKNDFKESEQEAESATVKVGEQAEIGNKGATIVRLQYRGTSLSFVNCHFANGDTEEHMEQRRKNYQQMLEGGKVGFKGADLTATSDHVILMGDLGSRFAHSEGFTRKASYDNIAKAAFSHNQKSLEKTLETAEALLKRAKEKAEETAEETAKETAEKAEELQRCERAVEAAEEPFQASEELIENDELTAYLGDVLEGFSEKELYGDKEVLLRDFAPTSWLDRCANFVYNKQTGPGWSDRIVWFSRPCHRSHNRINGKIEALHHPGSFPMRQKYYKTIPKVATSNHKPVKAMFALHTAPPLEVSQEPEAYIVISELQGFSLMQCDTEASDPYVVFDDGSGKGIQGYLGQPSKQEYTKEAYPLYDPKFERFKTNRVPKELNPTWADNQIPYLPVHVGDLARLKDQCLNLCIFDYDGNTSLDDIMGHISINLGDVIRDEDDDALNTKYFDQKVVYCGTTDTEKIGRLKGKIEIVKANAWESERNHLPDPICCCIL